MVMLGLHQILTPIHLEMIQKLGFTPLLPILAMAGGGQVGAAIALWVKCRKNKQLVNMIKGALPVGILGVGEPLIYGVTLPLGRPFITACVGGGIGGAVVAAFGQVGSIAIGPSGVALIPLIAHNMWWAHILGLLASYVGGFIATYFWGVPKEAMLPADEADAEVKERREAEEQAYNLNMSTSGENEVKDNAKLTTQEIVAPVDGQIEELDEVEDQVFSQKMLGEGFAIIPKDGKIVAPVDGKVVSVMSTKHALTLKSTKGNLEILLHMGLDTVELKGRPFDIKVKENDIVKAGQPVAQMDIGKIKEAGKDPIVIMTITNMDDVSNFKLIATGTVKADMPVLKITSK